MDPRLMFSALIGVFFAAAIFATVTTVRHLSHGPDSMVAQPR
jgi:hypothetical protein